jgi:hypothetical protein
MKPVRIVFVLFLSCFIFACSHAGTFSLSLKYQPTKEFSALDQKMGPTVGIAPFKDERPDIFYVGTHIPYRGTINRFKCDPFPLEKAVRESLFAGLSGYGLKTVPVAAWDGQPESLKEINADSVLMIQIKKFWAEGRAQPFRTMVTSSASFVFHLGVKKEGKVYTRNVDIEKELAVPRMTPERMEQAVNDMLAEMLNTYLSKPY